jgi:hypothetical protein
MPKDRNGFTAHQAQLFASFGELPALLMRPFFGYTAGFDVLGVRVEFL